jgi:hypothetical protein
MISSIKVLTKPDSLNRQEVSGNQNYKRRKKRLAESNLKTKRVSSWSKTRPLLSLQRPSEDSKKRQKFKGSRKKSKKPAKMRKPRKNASLRKLSDDANKRRLKDVGSKKSPKSGAFRRRPIKGANKRRRTIFGELKRQGV